MGCHISWQAAPLFLLDLAFSWGIVLSLQEHNIVVPVFKHGDPSMPGNFRTLFGIKPIQGP